MAKDDELDKLSKAAQKAAEEAEKERKKEAADVELNLARERLRNLGNEKKLAPQN